MSKRGGCFPTELSFPNSIIYCVIDGAIIGCFASLNKNIRLFELEIQEIQYLRE